MTKKILSLLISTLFITYNFSVTATSQFFTDKLGITSIQVNSVIAPQSITELQTIVRTSALPISIAGACYSQGGQTTYPDGLVIDMKYLNKIIAFDQKEKTITVQTGATWYDVQRYIDPYNLSIKAMQSYNNFSIGGSLSVNAHGRDIQYGSVINGIRSIEIMLANGTIITASRTENYDIFKAAIGGYGLLGIITQVTIELTDNILLERVIQPCTINNFHNIFTKSIASDESVVLYNADIFPKQYEQGQITTWHTTTKPVADQTRLQKQNCPAYLLNKALEIFVKYVPFAHYTRAPFEQVKNKKLPTCVVWRNNEMSYSVNQLGISYHFPYTMTLQEYFIPVEHAQAFAQKLVKILKKNGINVINVSIRHVKADTTSLMSYAPRESFAFVIYFNMFNTQKSIDTIKQWTRKIINTALKYQGTYYLPYIMSATQEQFQKAYPHFNDLLAIKKTYDPHNKFRNMLFEKYYEK